MLKTQVDNQIWLVQQHHHAQVSGYLAAYWGGVNGFARPGHYSGATAAARWRDEIILGIAEHDNGWWEWEAMPRINGQDGLPVGLGESAAPLSANEFDSWRADGFERWIIGINRIARAHAYAALLISYHAYWLYAVAFDDLRGEDGDAFRHSVFGDPETASSLTSDQKKTRAFLDELSQIQKELKQRLLNDQEMATAVEPAHLFPHVRLVQLLDSMSLYMARDDQDERVLRDVPRANWDNRVDMVWQRVGPQQYRLDPYPFEIDPLPVRMPARIATNLSADVAQPLTTLHRLQPDTLSFEVGSYA